MALPVYFGVGYLSVYGIGSNTGQNGIVAPSGFVFNTVNRIWDGGGINFSEGDSIMYKIEDVECTLAWDNGQYGLLKTDKVILTEYTVIPS